jgi:hypothetical protein
MGASISSLSSRILSGSCRRRKVIRRNTAEESIRARQNWRSAVTQLKQLFARRKAWAAEGHALRRWAPIFTHLERVRGALSYKVSKAS